MNISDQIVQSLLKNPPPDEAAILAAKRRFCLKLKISDPPSDTQLLAACKKRKITDQKLLALLRTRSVRTLSGIAPIAVLTRPAPCPGKCAYCPSQKQMPKSYLPNEPAVMRAVLCGFNPYRQVQLRLRALQNNGHLTDKLELIVMGGTWSYLPAAYQSWYIKECFRAANDFPKAINKKHLTQNQKLLKKLLKKEQKKNESAKNRIVGLTLETRPDYINPKELTRMREFGCTRIEIGVQHTDNKILDLNHRGHGIAATAQASALMRSFGFKITYHLMLNLPGSSPPQDLKMLRAIYADPRFMPDQIKLYPCVVTKDSLLYRWWRQGKWQAYTTRQLTALLIKIKLLTPPWVRLIRIVRDIPEVSIIAGNTITNLRQIIKSQMQKQKIHCRCIRCREAGHASRNQKSKIKNQKLFIRTYPVSNGTEYFISFESSDQKILFAFCRLFLPDRNPPITNYKLLITNYPALVRELHTYGELVPLSKKGLIQHTGLGKKLMAEAEQTARQNGFKKISVIAGIGVRPYYRRLGYRLQNTYMVKNL